MPLEFKRGETTMVQLTKDAVDSVQTRRVASLTNLKTKDPVDKAALMAAQSQSFIEGQRVWVPSSSSSEWACGVIVGVTRSADEQVTLNVEINGTMVSVPAMQCFLLNESDPDDLTKSDYLHEPGILHTLRSRFDLDTIYTYSGQILIALNPFKPLKHLYGPRMMAEYKEQQLLEDLSPHCYAVAEAAYSNMMIDGHRQAVLISGESGAGKTVTARLVMAYLAERSGGNAAAALPIEQQILESNPLLEAFGNAKTVRNDNSSRFGKFVEIDFSEGGRVSGAYVSTYLLERSRVVSVAEGERGFHVFYQMLAGFHEGSHEGLRERLFLTGMSAKSFSYLAQSSATSLTGTDDRAAFEETLRAMKIVGLDDEQVEAVLGVVAAVLHLGNIRFEMAEDAKADEAMVCADEGSVRGLECAAALLGCEVEALRTVLMSRKITIGGDVIVKEFNVVESEESRDSLAKSLYGRLFEWVVSAVNQKIGRVGGGGRTARTIGILDIYGFESFETNSFEQLCINLANEKLQQSFNEHVFKEEQKVYVDEGIDWSYVDFVDNQDVLDLLEGTSKAVDSELKGMKGIGVFPLLDEACRLPRATNQDLAITIRDKLQKHPRFSAPKRDPSTFCINHYAGEVRYDTSACMLERNRDFVVAEQETLLAGSSKWLPRALYEIGASQATNNGQSSGHSPGHSVNSGFKLSTIGSTFCKQLNVLAGKLNEVDPHYIRCIKPNEASRPGILEPSYVMDQLRAGGVLEAVRIACAGFPTRKDFAPFARRYIMLAAKSDLEGKGFPKTDGGAIDWLSLSLEQEASIVGAIMRNTSLEGWQLGRTKIFLRTGHLAYLETSRGRILTASVIVIQTSWRTYAVRVRYQKMMREQKAALRIQAFWRMQVIRKDYETELQRRREESAAVRIQTFWRMVSARRSFIAQCSFLKELARKEAEAAAAAAYEADLEAARLIAIEAEEARRAAAASALESENEALRAEVAALKSTIADLEYKLADLVSQAVQASELANKGEEANKINEEMRSAALEDLHEKMEQLNLRHADEIQVLRESISNSAAISKAREEDVSREIAAKDAEVARLVSELDAATARIEQLSSDVANVRELEDGRLREATEELLREREAASEASLRVRQLESLLKAEQDVSSSSTTTIQALKSDNAVMSSRIESLLLQLERAEGDIAQLKRSLLTVGQHDVSRSRSTSFEIERPASLGMMGLSSTSGAFIDEQFPPLHSLDEDKAALVDLVVRHLVKQPSIVVTLKENVPFPLNSWRLRNFLRNIVGGDNRWNPEDVGRAVDMIANEFPSEASKSFSSCLGCLNLVIAASALIKVDTVGQVQPQHGLYVQSSHKLLETPDAQLWAVLADFVVDKVPINVGSLLKEDARKSARIRGSKALKHDSSALTIEGRLECMGSSCKDWMRLVGSIDTLIFVLLDASLPPPTTKAILFATLRWIDGTIFNALLMRRELCSVSSARAILTALAIVEQYMTTYKNVSVTTDEFREAFRRTLQASWFVAEWFEDAVRQARGGMTENSALAKCSALTMLQLRRIAEQRHDDWMPSFASNTETTILLQALKSKVEEGNGALNDSEEALDPAASTSISLSTSTPAKQRAVPSPDEMIMPSPMSDVFADDDASEEILVDPRADFALHRRGPTRRLLRETSIAFFAGDGGLSAIDSSCSVVRGGALPAELTAVIGSV